MIKDWEIAKELYNFQKQSKCLVLLDDIWTTSAWDSLRAAFPQGKTGSKILLTTRIKNVDQNGFIHEPQCLNEDERWMYAFLKDADAHAHARDGDERVHLWVVQIRENSHALEGVIETYIFKVASKSQGGHMITLLNRSVSIFTEGFELYKVGSKIKKISSNIAALTSNLQTYGIRELRAKEGETSSRHIQEQRELRRAYSHVVEHDVVGFHIEIKGLERILIEEGNHRVISVCMWDGWFGEDYYSQEGLSPSSS